MTQVWGEPTNTGTEEHNYLVVNDDGSILTKPAEGGVSDVNIQGVEKVAGRDGIDGSTNSLQVVSYDHHEIHTGDHYFIKTWVEDTGASGNATFFAFTTPDSTKWIHAKALIAPDVDFTITIYEDGDITGGTPIPAINNNRNSSNTAGLVAVGSPTVNAKGRAIWAARNGGGRNAVGVAPAIGYEIIAKQNSTYIFELIKNTTADGVLDIDFFWYEHTDKS